MMHRGTRNPFYARVAREGITILPSALGITVYHVVLWTEDAGRIGFALGAEGALASRDVAERCVEAYRERVEATSTRVGILEMPAPDPRMNHPAPRGDIENLVAEIHGG